MMRISVVFAFAIIAASSQAPAQAPAFSGDASGDLIKAAALFDNIRVLGRDCEWALKVDRSKSAVCRSFMAKVSPSGDLGAIAARVNEIKSNPSAMSRGDIDELQRINRILRDVLRYKEFATANLGN